MAEALAGACGNRTHPGRHHHPAHGFEDREGHQTPFAPLLLRLYRMQEPLDVRPALTAVAHHLALGVEQEQPREARKSVGVSELGRAQNRGELELVALDKVLHLLARVADIDGDKGDLGVLFLPFIEFRDGLNARATVDNKKVQHDVLTTQLCRLSLPTPSARSSVQSGAGAPKASGLTVLGVSSAYVLR